jgi:hypothetical protein
MDIVFWWLALSVLCGIIGSSRGRSGFLVFLAAVFLTPLLTLIFVLAVPKKADNTESVVAVGSDQMVCPQCAETVRRAAKICRFCGIDLVAHREQQDEDRRSEEWIERRFERWLREQNPPVIDPHPTDRAELKKGFLWRLKQGEIND